MPSVKSAKKVIKAPLEIGKEFVNEAKRQIASKPIAPEELLGLGQAAGQKQIKAIKQREEEELRKVRMEKARFLAQWRQRYQEIQRKELEAGRRRMMKEEEEEKKERLKKEEEAKKEPMASGAEAIAATGGSQKRPSGLWGIGKKFKKMFKWSTGERKGKSPN